MKRKIVGIISIIIVLLLVFIASIYFINKNYTNKQIDAFINKYQVFYQYINKHPIYDEGVIDVSANYRGAHGENYPNKFKYNYKLEDSLAYFSNEEGYKEYKYDSQLYELIKKIRALAPNELNNIIRNSKIKDNKVIVDVSEINKITNSNIKEISITFNSSNIIKKLKSIEIKIDDIVVIIDDTNIDINSKNDNINIRINSAGYFLNINDTLKMNAFLNSDKNTYSIVIDDKVIRVEVSDTELKVFGGFESAIYNSIELSITKEKVSIVKTKELELESVPMLRYFINTDLSYWN